MKTLITFLLISVAAAGFPQDKKCLKKLKTGNFTYPGKEKEVVVIRTKEEQIEQSLDGNYKIIMAIEWKSDNEYILTVKKLINVPGCLKIGDKILVRITKCDENGFAFDSVSKDCGGSSGYLKYQ